MNKFEIPRVSDRRQMRVLVDGRVRSRQVYVDLFDLSEGGCKIKGRHGFVTAGETVNLKIAGFKTPLGTVAWVDNEYAGVAFDGRLHPAVLDHICKVQAKT